MLLWGCWDVGSRVSPPLGWPSFARKISDACLAYARLRAFLDTTMQMRHVYQPVMLETLLLY